MLRVRWPTSPLGSLGCQWRGSRSVGSGTVTKRAAVVPKLRGRTLVRPRNALVRLAVERRAAGSPAIPATYATRRRCAGLSDTALTQPRSSAALQLGMAAVLGGAAHLYPPDTANGQRLTVQMQIRTALRIALGGRRRYRQTADAHGWRESARYPAAACRRRFCWCRCRNSPELNVVAIGPGSDAELSGVQAVTCP